MNDFLSQGPQGFSPLLAQSTCSLRLTTAWQRACPAMAFPARSLS